MRIVHATAGGGDDVGAACAVTLIVAAVEVGVIGTDGGESIAAAPLSSQFGEPIVIDPPGPVCCTVNVCAGPPTVVKVSVLVETINWL